MLKEVLNLIWENLIQISPPIFWAGLVLLLGVIVAKTMERLTVSFLNKIRLNQVLKRIGWEEALSKVEIRLEAPKFIGQIVKWFFVIIFLMASSEILGLTQFSQFLEKVVSYFPNIFISILIFIVFVFLADFSQKIFVGSLEKEKITYSKFFGKGFSLTIWILAILAILYQLKIVPTLILAIFIGVITIIVLALGISFGLGGRDFAAKILEELKEKFK